MIIITNNNLVKDEILSRNLAKIEYYELSNIELLNIIRDKIHMGYELLTHPLSGSVKPNEKRFLSVAISEKQKNLDMNSLNIIEESIEAYKKFVKDDRVLNEKVINDLKLIDYTLIMSIF